MSVALPMRMNLVRIKLRRLNVPATPQDSDFREPMRSKAFEEVEVQGQVNFGSKQVDQRGRTMIGDWPRSSAHLVFKMADLQAAGFEPRKGDRVSEIAGRPLDFEIGEVRPESPLRGAFLLLYCEMEEVKEERASV